MDKASHSMERHILADSITLDWEGESSMIADNLVLLKRVLGTSTGRANQSFRCGLLPRSIWVREDCTDSNWVEWCEAEDLSQSDGESRHYTIDRETGVIHFGDGMHGKIPPAGGKIAASYRCGAREKGEPDLGASRAESEYVRMYYEHQYDRMAKLEDQRLIITNIVIGLTTVTFTFGISKTEGLTAFSGVCLPFVMVLSNFLAMAYAVHSADVIKAHQKRAKKVLRLYAKDLHELDQGIPWSRRIGPRWKIQLLIHLALVIIALTPLYVYLAG
jgi:hypothetical protein